MQFWIRRSALTVAILLSLAACAGDAGTQEPTDANSPATSEATSTSQASSDSTASGGGGESTTSTQAEVSDSPPQVEGPAAPDFTFALSDGSSFSLSDEQKPVYLVFWAEW